MNNRTSPQTTRLPTYSPGIGASVIPHVMCILAVPITPWSNRRATWVLWSLRSLPLVVTPARSLGRRLGVAQRCTSCAGSSTVSGNPRCHQVRGCGQHRRRDSAGEHGDPGSHDRTCTGCWPTLRWVHRYLLRSQRSGSACQTRHSLIVSAFPNLIVALLDSSHPAGAAEW
jgi:hypothetical protein